MKRTVGMKMRWQFAMRNFLILFFMFLSLPVHGAGNAVLGVREEKYPVLGAELKMSIFVPHSKNEKNSRAIVFYPDKHDKNTAAARMMAGETGAVILIPAYRKSRQDDSQIYNDAFAAYAWAVKNAASWGGSPELIAVAGEGSGADIAAHVSIMARDTQFQLPAHMVLAYPDLTMPGINEEKTSLLDYNLQGLPCATLIGAEQDPQKNQVRRLAQMLDEAGVPLNDHTYKAEEGFLRSASDEARAAQEKIATDLDQAFLEIELN